MAGGPKGSGAEPRLTDGKLAGGGLPEGFFALALTLGARLQWETKSLKQSWKERNTMSNRLPLRPQVLSQNIKQKARNWRGVKKKLKKYMFTCFCII